MQYVKYTMQITQERSEYDHDKLREVYATNVYNLRPKSIINLIAKNTELNNRNFLLRILYCDCYTVLASNVFLLIIFMLGCILSTFFYKCMI